MGPQADTAVPSKRSMPRRFLGDHHRGGRVDAHQRALLPDLDFSGQDRVAIIRIEGVILDAQSTISELKQYSENPLVKAIVLRIDSPGAESCPRRKYTMR